MDGDAALADESDDRLLAWVADGDYPDLPFCILPPSQAELLALSESADGFGLAATGALESGVTAALAAAVEAIAGDALDADAEALARVLVRRKALERQGDPLGLMDGDGICNDGPDTNAPTDQRVGHGEVELINVTVGAGKDQSADVWKAVPLVETMVKRKYIAKDQEAAFKEAARQFYRDFVMGHRAPSVTARYGELTSGGGTPASQQTERYVYDKFGRAFEAPGPEDVRHDAHTRWIKACHAIGMTRCKITGNPKPTQTLEWMLQLVCEAHTVIERTPTLEDAGRAHTGHKNPSQAAASGASLIKSGLERLVAHYGIDL